MRGARGMMDDDLPTRRLPWHRSRRGRPRVARLVVANEQRFASWIDNRIVFERRQSVFPTVLGPGVRRTRRRDYGAEAGIRDDVRPRQRGLLIALYHNRVGPP